MDKLTIGQLAKQTGLTTVAIRHYERIGLLPMPSRDDNGYRQYPNDAVKRVRFVVNAKEAGFSLKEICDLFETQHKVCASSKDIKQLVLEKSAAIRERIDMLKKFASTLDRLANLCDGKLSINQCPILEALYMESKEIAHDSCVNK